MSDKHPAIIDVSADTFEIEVLEQSRQVPILVDFWAEWCGPCRTLGPLLERLAAEYDGRFILAKANVDKLPDVAREFRVMSIPAVFAVRDGQIRDSFVGVISEREIRAFIDRMMPSPADSCVAEAQKLEATDTRAAEAKYREAITLAGKETGPTIALARFFLGSNQLDECRGLLDGLAKRGYLEADAEKLKAELTVRTGGHDAGSLETARKAAAEAPNDLHARFRLAEALAAAQEFPEALDVALDLVERNRAGVGEEARKLMLAVFQMLPADSPLTIEYRRKLSFAL